MKTYILIPFKNESARLTGKNMMLLPFTLEWIEKELEGLEEEVEVHTFGCISTDKRKGIESYGVEHVRLKFFEDRSHQGALENTLKKLGVKPEDRIIQLQLTQPKRKEGLLKEAIEALKEDPSRPIITVTKVHIENRLVNDEGRRFYNQPEDLLLYDGGLYGGTLETWRNWFDLKHVSRVLINDEMSVVDIDDIKDLLTHTNFTL